MFFLLAFQSKRSSFPFLFCSLFPSFWFQAEMKSYQSKSWRARMIHRNVRSTPSQYLAKLPRLTNCSPVRKYQFQCFPDHFDFWFLKFVESNIVTSTKPSSKLMDCGFFRGMLWSVVPRSCGWVSLSLNLPLKAAKITQQSIDCVVGSAGSNFCSRPIISDLLGLSEHSDLFILFTWVHPGFGQTTPRIKWFNAWSFD